MLAVVASYIVNQVSTGVPPSLYAVISIVGQMSVAISVAFYAFCSIEPQRLKVGWRYIGLACLVESAVDIWNLTAPDPASISVGYVRVACLFLLLSGVFCHAVDLRVKGAVRTVIESLLLSIGLSLLVWHFIFADVWERSSLATTEHFSLVATPVVSVVLASFAFFIARGASEERQYRRKHAMLALSLLGFSLSYMLLVYSKLSGLGLFSNVGWVVNSAALLLLGYSALLTRDSSQHTSNQQDRHPLGIICQYKSRIPISFALASLTAVFLYSVISGFPLSSTTMAISLILLFLAVIRQGIVIVEEKCQNEFRQKAIKEELESIVNKRTSELRSMLDLTASVNRELDVARVTQEALKYIEANFENVSCAIVVEDTVQNLTRLVIASSGGKPIFTETEVKTYINSLIPESDGDVIYDFMPHKRAFAIAQPLLCVAKSLGWIVIARRDQAFNAEEQDLFKGVGLVLAPALGNAMSLSQAQFQAQRDPITGLINHRLVHEHLDLALAFTKGNRQEMVVAMVDLDNFQLLNATYGHTAGDKLLKIVANATQSLLVGDSVVGRFGSDEFVLVLPNHTIEEASDLITQLNEILMNTEFNPLDDERRLPLSVTCGLASYPHDCLTYEELLATADRNLTNARFSDRKIGTTTDIQRIGKSLQSHSSFNILDMLVTAVDNKDSYTRRHSEQVAEFAMWICEELDVDSAQRDRLQMTALLHDVGKIGVPQEILSKPGRLTPEETAQIEKHCWIGSMLLGSFPDMVDLAIGVKHHHERWDGSGYPDALKGDEIPWSARVLAVADSFSAMTTHRVYRRALDFDVAIGEIEKNSGKQFDPAIAEAFIRIAKRKHQIDQEPLQEAA